MMRPFLTAVGLAALAAPAIAQPYRMPQGVPLHRLDYRDLGYRHFNEIPGDAARITSLATASDGRIFGATSGHAAHLFVYSPATNQVKPLGVVPGAAGVHHGLAATPAGQVFLGTGKNVLEPLTIQPDLSFGYEHISADLWTQVEQHYADDPGGHLYQFDLTQEPTKAPPGQTAPLVDLGVPVKGDGIYCLTADPERAVLYGLTYPHGHFFVHDLAARKSTDIGPICKNVLFADPDDRSLRMLPRALIVAPSGDVYASTDDARILRFDVKEQKLVPLPARLPGEAMQVVDAWARHGDALFGGTSEGFIFKFTPSTGEIENLGKPMLAQRIRGLTVGRDGKLYGLAGERSVPNLFFTYDPATRSFQSLGGIVVDRSPYYSWRAHQFDAMTTGADGTIFMGESDRRGHLFLYLP